MAEVARAYRGFNVNLRLAPRKSIDGIRQVGAFAVAAVFGVGAETFNRFQAQWRDLCAAGYRRHSTLLILVPSFFESLANTAKKLFGSGIDRAVGFANLHEVDRNEYTDLSMSVFMKPGANGTILPARQSISAILLIGVHGRDSVVYGILHPEAAYPFNQGFLPKVPFIRIAKWPIVDGKIWTEWVIANPPGKTVPHWKISLPRPKRKRVDPRETVSVDE